jgi:hypothetical protein
MRILEISTEPLWHQKAFSIRLNISEAKRILIWYHNGNRKPWWLRTDRAYRFRRLTWLKAPFVFRSIANENSQGLILWVFTGWLTLPKKIFVPLKVGRLSLLQPNLNTLTVSINSKNKFETKKYQVTTKPGEIMVRNVVPNFKRPVFTEFNIHTKPIGEPALKTFENLNQ